MKMSGGTNQRTLFQTWGASVSQNKTIQPPQNGKKASEVSRPRPPSSKTAKVATTPRASLWTEFGHTSENSGKTEDILQENEDDDDELMVVAVYEAEKSLQLGNRLEVDSCVAVDDEATLPPPSSATQTYPDFPDFDSSSAKVWIYPTNYPIRNYQLKISEAALFQNTLVCLPTGLGKTFIASVVMYNFYRWYPSGKIVFMAPTKPLVAQQIEACYKVMGIPQTHMAELTGMDPKVRSALRPFETLTSAFSHRKHSCKAEAGCVEVQARLLPHPAGHGERSVQRHLPSQAGQVCGDRRSSQGSGKSRLLSSTGFFTPKCYLNNASF